MSEATGILKQAETPRGNLTLEYASHMHGRVYFVRLVKSDGTQTGSAVYIARQPAEEIFEAAKK